MKKVIISLVVAVLWSSGLFSQDLQFVKQQVDTLTSADFYGRGYVNKGTNIAADYLKSQLEDLDLKPFNNEFHQDFTFPVNTFPAEISISIDGTELNPGVDFIPDPASGSAKGKFSVFAIDSTNISIVKFDEIPKKAVLVVNEENISTPDMKEKLKGIMIGFIQKGPVISLSKNKLTWGVARSALPNAFISLNTDKFNSKAKTFKINISNKHIASYKAENVIAYVPAQAPSDSFIVFTAHYDHLGMMGDVIFPGANDNASGTAMLLDLAAFYQENPVKHNVVFMFFAAEEAGLIGSQYFVENPLFPLEKIKFLINLDLMGSAKDGITVVNGRQFPELMSLMLEVNEKSEYLPQIKARGPAANSDHYWFSENGVEAVFIYTLGEIIAYHDVYDTAENLSFTNYDALFSLLHNFIDEYLKN